MGQTGIHAGVAIAGRHELGLTGRGANSIQFVLGRTEALGGARFFRHCDSDKFQIAKNGGTLTHPILPTGRVVPRGNVHAHATGPVDVAAATSGTGPKIEVGTIRVVPPQNGAGGTSNGEDWI